jgi:hypothetical protein
MAGRRKSGRAWCITLDEALKQTWVDLLAAVSASLDDPSLTWEFEGLCQVGPTGKTYIPGVKHSDNIEYCQKRNVDHYNMYGGVTSKTAQKEKIN